MSYCEILDIDGQTMAEVERITTELGPEPIAGLIVQAVGPAATGVRMVSVWESRADHDRFIAERLHPAFERAGGRPRHPMTQADFDVERLTLSTGVG